MERKGKKALVLGAALLLVGGAGVFTYAKYTSSATGTSTVTASKWDVKVNNTAIASSETFTASSITWTTRGTTDANTIAPGASGYFEVVIDNSTTEVPVNYTVALGDSVTKPTGMTITAAVPADLTGTLAAGATAKTIRYNVTWAATGNDANDTSFGSGESQLISIPVDVTVEQDTTQVNPSA